MPVPTGRFFFLDMIRTPERTMKDIKVLIVENEMIVAMMIKLKLAKMGYCVAGVVSTGEDAIHMVKEKLPDLVLMDIWLKGDMDGVEAAMRIRRGHNVPIVFLTGDSSQQLRNRAELTNPSGFLYKPFMDEELEYMIRSALDKHRALAGVHA